MTDRAATILIGTITVLWNLGVGERVRLIAVTDYDK